MQGGGSGVASAVRGDGLRTRAASDPEARRPIRVSMKPVKILVVLFTLAASLALFGALRPETPVLGPAVKALRDGNPGRALAVVAPSLVPKTTYWSYPDPRGSLKIVASLDEVPVDLRERAKRMEVESTPLLTSAAGVDARAGATSASQAPKSKPTAGSGGGAGERSAATKPRVAGPVTIYVTSWCPHCSALADLDARGVTYTKKNIDDDPRAKSELRAKAGLTSVPHLEVGGRLHAGYSPQLYAQPSVKVPAGSHARPAPPRSSASAAVLGRCAPCGPRLSPRTRSACGESLSVRSCRAGSPSARSVRSGRWSSQPTHWRD